MTWIRQGQILTEQAQLPVVDIYKTKYRIYYSKRIDGKSNPMWVDVDRNNPKKILGRCKEPILQLGKPGTFDWAGIMPTKIITNGNIKYLYYIGWTLRQDVPYHNCLGLALSKDDGNIWEKISEGPIFNTSLKEPGFIGTVEITREHGMWDMHYLSCREWVNHKGIMEPVYDIKYAVSTNGIEWIPQNITCVKLQENEGGIVSPQIQKINGEYHMWFAVRGKFDYRTNPACSYNIQKAVSKNLYDFKRIEQPELLPTFVNGWENQMVCYPCVIKEKDKLLMWYNGNSFGQTGIGYCVKILS